MRQRMLYGLRRRAAYWADQVGRLQTRPEFQQFLLYDTEFTAPTPPATPVGNPLSRKAAWSVLSLSLMQAQPMDIDSPAGCDPLLFSRLTD